MSKLNKKLPKPSNICFMKSDRKSRTNQILMDFGSVVPSGWYLGWRQSSFTYSYQVQYYIEARLIPEKQLSTGSSTSKTKWKYPNTSWSTKVSVDNLNRCVAMDKKNRYYRYSHFGNKSLMTKGSYDRLIVVARVRSYNPKAKQHGQWVTGRIVINCVPEVSIEKAVALADGGVRLYLNTHGWTRGDSRLIVRGIYRSSDAESNLLKAETTLEVESIGGEEAADFPFVEIDGNCFNDGLLPSDEVVFDCEFRTCDGLGDDGENTVFGREVNQTVMIDAVSAVIDAPTVVALQDEDTGTITATVSKSDAADDWDSVKSWMICTVDGEEVRFDPVASIGSDDSSRTFKFQPPLDSEAKLHVGITNDLGGAFSKTYTVEDLSELKPIPSKDRVLISYTDGKDKQPMNGMFYGSKTVAMNYEIEKSVSSERPYETELPFGRSRPVAFLGDGLKSSISLKGSIDATQDGYFETVPFSGELDWRKFQEQQGIVLLRMPNGRWHHALCTSLSIEQSDEYDETKTVNLSFEEVDV